jgi:hypothetical protein
MALLTGFAHPLIGLHQAEFDYVRNCYYKFAVLRVDTNQGCHQTEPILKTYHYKLINII